MSLSRKLVRYVVVSSFVTAMFSTPLFASETEDLKKEIELLKEQIKALEVRLEKTEAKTESQAEAKASLSSPVSEGLVSITKDISLHGYVDTSVTINANTPASPNPLENRFRVFDKDANSFMFNMAKINLEKPTSKKSPIGFRIDLAMGQDAKVIHSAGLGTSDDAFDLEQAYAELEIPYSFPLLDTVKIKAGKFVTLHGAEVIESPDNWNFSRSYLFGYAIPFTHTGIRAYYKPSSDWPIEGYFGVNNGWDVTKDNNKAKSIESNITVYPLENFTLSLNGMFGPERQDSNKDFRNLLDFVATYKVTDKFTVKVNYDYGWEKNGVEYGKNSSWDGIAAYAKYDLLDWWSIAARGEFFHDRDGVRTGVRTSDGINNVKFWEGTLTSEFRIFKDLITRLEYRYDKANEPIFYKSKATSNHQNTIAAEAIYKF